MCATPHNGGVLLYSGTLSGGGEINPTPDKKDGLSGGAIAGIVIGSVAVVGIG